jgi:hypothetical protein
MTPGLRNAQHIPDIPATEYHNREEWSQSQFKKLPKDPELFHGLYVTEPPLFVFETTADMELGTQLHALVLELQELLIIPQTALTSNGQRRGKNWDAWCDEHPDDPGVLPKDSHRIISMRDGIMADPVLRKLFEAEGETEHTIVLDDEATDLGLRARLDKLSRFTEGYVIADIKATSIDVTSERQIASKVFEMGYHQQAAFYWDAAELLYGTPLRFVFAFVRSKPPFNAVAWCPNDNDLDLGRRHNRLAIDDLKRRLDSGDWHGDRFGRLNYFSLPNWAYTDDPLIVPAPYQEFDEFSTPTPFDSEDLL